jgi:hypothetical protein
MPAPNEEFESAFDDASADTTEEAAAQSLKDTGDEYSAEGDEQIGSGEVATEEAPVEEAPIKEAPNEEAPTEEAPTEDAPVEEAPIEEAPTEEAPAAKKPGSLDEEQLAAAYRRLRQEEADNERSAKPAEEAPAVDDPRQKTWRDYVSEDNQKVLEPYETDWSEVSQAEQIKRDAQLQHVQDVVYSDLKAVLAPIVEHMKQSKVEAHFNAIRQEHADIDDVKEDLNRWVDEQPEFVRPAFEQVLKTGSAKQVVELLNAYKQATGKTGAAPEVPASSASNGAGKKPQRTPPSAGAKRALAATPSTKRKDPPRQADPDDFSSAFDEAASSVGGI